MQEMLNPVGNCLMLSFKGGYRLVTLIKNLLKILAFTGWFFIDHRISSTRLKLKVPV
jgi:hypothetical protein